MGIVVLLFSSALVSLILLTQPDDLKELAILLPEEGGKSSAIVVKSGGQTAVVTEPYQAVELSGGNIKERTFTPEEIQRMFPDLMAALPEKPRSFTLRFEQGGIALAAESTASIDDIKRDIAKRNAPEVTVTGYTDRAGTEEDNLALSLERAKAIRDTLIADGISAEIISVIGRGELDPEVPTEDGIEEPRNRRVEVKIR